MILGEEDKLYRFQIFKENVLFIEDHNTKQLQQGNESFRMGINKFILFSLEEFKSLYSHPFSSKQLSRFIDSEEQKNQLDISELQKTFYYRYQNQQRNLSSIDWVQKGVVLTDLPDEGQCGSCYSFTTNGNLQSINILQGGPKVVFSNQQIIDCSISYGNQGCSGGTVDQSLDYVIEQGIESNQAYPYKGFQGACKYNPSLSQNIIDNYFYIQKGNCLDLQDSLMKQPIAVAVDSSAWRFYTSGILPMNQCGYSLDHAVLLVGMNLNNNFWQVQNWWGKDWGENGFIRLQIGNTCGICLRALSGILKN